MKFFCAILAIAAGLFACNDSKKQIPTGPGSVVVSEQATPTMEKLCFSLKNLNDTIELDLTRNGNEVAGTLVYLYKEKDSNRGTIAGTLRSDTLIADYTFMSEGVASVRQVAFLIEDNRAIEGYADLEQKDGKMVFKDISKITFGKGLLMNKADCK